MGRPRTAEETAEVEANREALAGFRRQAVKKAPTQKHRAALWENMLGTVYAMNRAGEVRYFDYDYVAAVAFIGSDFDDVRVAKFKRTHPVSPYGGRSGDYDTSRPRHGQFVWFVRDAVQERYRLETRNDFHESTREWHSRNPFNHGQPWVFDTVEEAKARGEILMGTSATAFRIVNTDTNAVVYRHEAEQ